ncbi:hypothetical protein [Paraburkholderia sp.]|uniref:hypothetical protein n=1 Tax=Paraburkholderia sp. TaxID=1926495 RepID=UPI0025F16FEF|nr:hypothetical protein [Paraburkholderia sp.]
MQFLALVWLLGLIDLASGQLSLHVLQHRSNTGYITLNIPGFPPSTSARCFQHTNADYIEV